MPAESTYVPISTYTAPANTVNNVVFSSIPQTYTDLRLVISGRGIASTTVEDVWFYATPYATDQSFTYIQPSGSAITAGRVTNVNQTTIGAIPSGTATSGIYSNIVLDLFNYSNTTTFKSYIARNTNDMNGSGIVFLTTGLKRNTSAVTSLVIFPSASTYWAAGSVFTLYGIKGA